MESSDNVLSHTAIQRLQNEDVAGERDLSDALMLSFFILHRFADRLVGPASRDI
jgi:hypothetical protein